MGRPLLLRETLRILDDVFFLPTTYSYQSTRYVGDTPTSGYPALPRVRGHEGIEAVHCLYCKSHSSVTVADSLTPFLVSPILPTRDPSH